MDSAYLCFRWDAAKGADIDNLVLLTFDEADQHDESQGRDMQPEIHQYVTSRLKLVQSAYQLNAVSGGESAISGGESV